ncbi:endoplasmic reticulum metallopeptidase 1-like [Octopus sinensis]|uniref:Endoplasmic reticulum metallopeptidase 1-like n=1 Tax=Octopus sinensis TaxID=2607531 RepID=A0A6P7TQW9_9MOLL|nr:endoplasmic reticulum metallopeptidase 1-like [Octopus sinensis]
MTNFGVKNSGSNANENVTVQFILETVKKIINSPQNSKNIVYDLQVVSGTFLLNFVESFISVYDKVQNIVVRVGQSSDCLLINCHFDSALSRASDDLISCANMLEVLRIVSLQATDARNCLIFLFNGAEENILQASHGFITKHPWFKDVRGVVNLEASGSGGNQYYSGPGTSWLLYLYRDSVPYPYGTAAGQDLFQSGLIPSDTDYRIFRDYGNVSGCFFYSFTGLDLAFFTNGYVYHTPDDTDTRIDDCTISKAGTPFSLPGINLLALTKAFLVQPHFYSTDQKLAYFEVASTYFFVLPQSLVSFLCLGALVFALCSTYYGVMRHNYSCPLYPFVVLRMRYSLIYTTAVFLVIATFLASFGINYFLSRLFHALSLHMTWFALNFNLVLYAVPPFLVVLSFHHLNALIWNSVIYIRII